MDELFGVEAKTKYEEQGAKTKYEEQRAKTEYEEQRAKTKLARIAVRCVSDQVFRSVKFTLTSYLNAIRIYTCCRQTFTKTYIS